MTTVIRKFFAAIAGRYWAGCLTLAFTAASLARPTDWGLRDYGIEPSVWADAWLGCLGLEPTPELFVEHIVEVFREVRRVLRPDGVCWVNLGDSYAANPSKGASGGGKEADYLGSREATKQVRHPLAGLKPKDLIGVPWMCAFALRKDGWYLRADVPWVKRSPMPESCQDRPAKALEYVFLLAKSERCYFDMEAVKQPNTEAGRRRLEEGKPVKLGGVKNSTRSENPFSGVAMNQAVGRNFRNTDLWYQSVAPPYGFVGAGNELLGLDVNTQSYKGAHFATYPSKLVEPLILAGTSARGACPTCGAPWIRVVRRERVRTRPGHESKIYDRTTGVVVDDGQEKPWRDRAEIGNRDPGRHVTETNTIGWRPGCACHYKVEWLKMPPKPGKDATDDDKAAFDRDVKLVSLARLLILEECKALQTVPCVVLDPFGGSGTTGQVAKWLGRRSILIERNPEYVPLIVQRVNEPRRKPANRQAKPKPLPGQLSLFDGEAGDAA